MQRRHPIKTMTGVARSSLVLLCGLLAMGLALAADPPSIADFFRNPSVGSSAVSPSGRYAALSATDGTHGNLRLMIVDLQDITKSKVLLEYDDQDLVGPAWVNDNRLVFELRERGKAIGDRPVAQGLSIDRDGKDVMGGLHGYAIVRLLRDGSDDVIAARYIADRNQEFGRTDLYRFNVRSERAVLITSDAPDNAKYWLVDAMGRPRVAISESKYRSRLYWKATPAASWQQIREYDSLHDEGLALSPMAVTADNQLYAVGRLKPGDDTLSLLRLDMARPNDPPVAVVKIAGYDFAGSLVMDSKGDIKGVRYTSDADGTYWIDPTMKKIQDEIDRRLPGLSNRIDCGWCDAPTTMLVRSMSDRKPTIVSLFDPTTSKLTVLTQTRPWIKAGTMARQDMDRVTARDGMSFPVIVTYPPAGHGPAPAVVLVHGGPYVRGIGWGWDSQSQFLASRGYLVIEPGYRGTTGFGSELFHAGWKQWGLAMQDDIADATTWAIRKGYADPHRICIAGASYGGYATLMGLIRYPDLYRCGFEWAGVSDIDLMYSIAWSDADDSYKQYGMPVLLGDQVKDADQLARTSPIKRAAGLRQPLLMGYGGRDVRVPIDHGTAMRKALSKTNHDVEWVEYPLEGHGWQRDDSNADWWGRVEKFLDRNLKHAP